MAFDVLSAGARTVNAWAALGERNAQWKTAKRVQPGEKRQWAVGKRRAALHVLRDLRFDFSLAGAAVALSGLAKLVTEHAARMQWLPLALP